ncbi:hypothetical protein AVEN_43278-1 [Araneus ventricosus]|uniref:Uncharacterized protein n=1 Tax=Araneus ventricosus TaxID=182803 RepID=A0A4Y2GG04_ARAVE|nr:hypothetical protein AVEN_43278-1 [Araneus ventricosus]
MSKSRTSIWKLRKEDIVLIVKEMSLTAPADVRFIDLKNLIENSERFPAINKTLASAPSPFGQTLHGIERRFNKESVVTKCGNESNAVSDVGKSDTVTRSKINMGVKDERLMGSLKTDSEVQNEKGFSESETIVGLNTKINADNLFIRTVGSGVTVEHIDELEKGLFENDVVLKGGVNAVNLCLVEDS